MKNVYTRPHGLYVAHQAPLSTEFSRQEYLGSHSLHPGIEPWSPALQADSLLSDPPGKHTRASFIQIE